MNLVKAKQVKTQILDESACSGNTSSNSILDPNVVDPNCSGAGASAFDIFPSGSGEDSANHVPDGERGPQ